MKRLCALMATMIVVLAFSSGVARAATGPGNSWTQMDNHNWPAGSTNAACSPCVRWTKSGRYGYFEGTWSYGISGASFFHTDARSAMSEWSGQPYYSPLFSEGGCGNVCVSAQSLSSSLCGTTSVQYNATSHLITHADVYLNTTKSYTDGRNTSGLCDVRWTYHHEIGHAFSEGHSAVSTDLMYKSQTKTETVDADAQSELRAVYGAISGSGGTCGAATTEPGIIATDPSLDVCASDLGAEAKAKLLQLADSLSSTVSLEEGTPTAG